MAHRGWGPDRGGGHTTLLRDTDNDGNSGKMLHHASIFAVMIPRSGLCVGLDIDIERLPAQFQPNLLGMVEFGFAVIDATRSVASCYKLNLAFFEQWGPKGMQALYDLRSHCAESYVIADAKRGDIGNTSKAYARAVFEDLMADAVTVSPYMGADSVSPFLEASNKMVYVLALTSNPGSNDFQRLPVNGGQLFEHVIRTSGTWPRQADLGFVIGATNPNELKSIRQEFPSIPLLIPGIGSQGASAVETVQANGGGPAVYNVSRGLLYLDSTENCMAVIAEESARLHKILTSQQ